MKRPLGHIDRRQPLDRSHPLNRGLVSRWLPFGPWQGGGTLRDLCRKNNGTLTNGPTWGPGPNGFGAVSLDGTNDYVSVPSLGLSGATARTFVGLIRSDTSSGLRTVFRCGPDDVSTLQSFGLFCNVMTGSDLYVLFLSCDWYTGAVLTTGRWTHVTVTYSGGAVQTAGNVVVYVDGKPQSLTKIGVATGAANTNETAYRLGSDPHNGRYFQGPIASGDFYNRALSAAEIVAHADQTLRGYPDLLRWVPTGRTFIGGGQVALSLPADTAPYTYTAQSAGLLRGSVLTCAAATYTVTTQSAGLVLARDLPSDAAAYAVTAQSAGLLHGRVLPCDTAAYTYTAQSAGLLRGYPLTAAAAAYTVAAQSASLLRGLVLPCTSAAYTVTGTDATLSLSNQRSVAANAGTYVVTGSDTGILRGRVNRADTGAHVVTGIAASLLRGRASPASVGTYVVTGSAVTFPRTYVLTCASGSYSLSGTAANLARSRIMGSDAAGYTLTTQAASLLRGRAVPCTVAGYTVTAQTASLLRGRRPTASARAYTLAGDEASLIYSGDPSGGFGAHISKIPLRG